MLKRLPPLSDIMPVFAFIAFLFYGWSILVFSWKLSGWLFFLSLGEIAVILAFELTTNLIESLLLLLILLVVTAILPARILKNEFVVRGIAIAVASIGLMMLIDHIAVISRLGVPGNWPAWILVASLLGMMLARVASRVRFIGHALAWLGDRLTVFLFILMPMSAVAIVIVLTRLFL